MDVDEVRPALVARPPTALEEHRARDDAAGVAHQVLEDRELLRSYADGLARAGDAKAGRIELDVRDPEHRRSNRFTPAEDGAQPGQQLRECERLREVVVRTGVQARNAVLHRAARGEYENRDAPAPFADGAQQRETVRAGKAKVENQDVVAVDCEPLVCCLRRGRFVNGPTRADEAVDEGPAQAGVVFHEEQPHSGLASLWAPDPGGKTATSCWRKVEHRILRGVDEWRGLSVACRFQFGLAGLGSLLATVAARGPHGAILAAALAPIGCLYVAGTVLRDTMTAGAPRRRGECGAYLRHRYGGTQRLVDRRERRIVSALLARTGRPRVVLDMPSGYGRLTPLLDGVAGGAVVCADIARGRLAALPMVGRRPALVQADLRGAAPFRTAAADLVFTLRYLHHQPEDEQAAALAELTRISGRWTVVSYYRRSNLHAVVRHVQRVVRANRRRTPTMLDARTFRRMIAAAGCRRVAERAVLPGFHAQRIVLLEKIRKG